jgi:transcriptional regulator with GAF, ATPase, and Fis domain
VAQGRFRADLFARLSGYTLVLPPLRERTEDIGLLVAAILPRVTPNAAGVRFSSSAARSLLQYHWPLNIRELEQCLRTAVLLAPASRIESTHLPPAVRAPGASIPPNPMPVRLELAKDDKTRRDQLAGLLREHGGNISAVARTLGKARSQVQRWVKRYGLEPSDPV